MSEFKMGDKIYCPRLTTQILTIQDDGDGMFIFCLGEYFYLNNDGRILSTPISLIADIFHANRENYKKITAMYDIELQAPEPSNKKNFKQISKITFEFLGTQECVITAYLENDDGAVETLDYTLIDSELEYAYIMECNIYVILSCYYRKHNIISFGLLLNRFSSNFFAYIKGCSYYFHNGAKYFITNSVSEHNNDNQCILPVGGE